MFKYALILLTIIDLVWGTKGSVSLPIWSLYGAYKLLTYED